MNKWRMANKSLRRKMADKDWHAYYVFGMRVHSTISLNTPPIIADNKVDADIVIREGIVPESLTNCLVRKAIWQANESEYLLNIEGLARYWAKNGHEIVIELDAQTDDLEGVRTFLQGSVLAMLLHQRRIIPLHAAIIQGNGITAAIMGISGAGKSTAAMALRQQGYNVLNDDVCAVRTNSDSAIEVVPGFAQIKLWQDSIDALCMDNKHGERIRSKLDKFVFPADRTCGDKYFSLDRIINLQVHNLMHYQVQTPNAKTRFKIVQRHIYRRQQIEACIKDQLHFQTGMLIAKSIIPMQTLIRPQTEVDIKEYSKQLISLLS